MIMAVMIWRISLEHSEVKDTVTVNNFGHTWHVPAGIIDNRSDMTSFLRADASEWKQEKIDTITKALRRYRRCHVEELQ
jgi:hypothetical protein